MEKKNCFNFRTSDNYGHDCLHCLHIEGREECPIVDSPVEACNICDVFFNTFDNKKIDKEYMSYVDGALKTESYDQAAIMERFCKSHRLAHAIIGISTEAGELLDAIKKYIYYGKPIDFANIAEEIGDFNWYEAVLIDECDFQLSGILKTNLTKLAKRYGAKFSSENAIERNLEEERKILESGLKNKKENKNG